MRHPDVERALPQSFLKFHNLRSVGDGGGYPPVQFHGDRLYADVLIEQGNLRCKGEAQGVKEGWRRDKYPLNLNSAPESDLSHLPGLTQDDAHRIVSHRPYRSSSDLVTGHILTEQQYRGLKDLVVAK